MRIETLLSPGKLTNGIRLRTEAAKAISSVEIVAGRTPGGKTVTAATLAAFFTDAASKLSALSDNTAPTVTTRAATNSTTATITFSEPLDTTVKPALGTVTVGARVLSALNVVGSTLVITGVSITAADVVTYTAPATNYLRDRAGNKVLTFTGALA